MLADHITGADPKAAYHGSRTATKLKVAGVDVAVDGRQGARSATTTSSCGSPSRARGVYKSVVIRDGKLVGATLLGDVEQGRVPDAGVRPRAAAARGAGAAAVRPRHGPPARSGAAELADDAQVCNCNGVTKGDLVGVRAAAARRSVTGVMDATRAGKGCGSCKALVAQIVEWAAGGDGRGGPVRVAGTCPAIPLRQAGADGARSASSTCSSVSAVFAALAPDGEEDAESKMALASLLQMMWGDEYVDERDARFINDRVHANIQRDGTFSVVPQMKGGVTTADAAAPDRRRRRQVRRPDDQAHRRAAHRPARHAQGGPARRSGPTSTCRRATPTARASAP